MESLNLENLEKKILPSLFVGGNCLMMQLYQNFIAIIQYFIQPILFLTFITNFKQEKI